MPRISESFAVADRFQTLMAATISWLAWGIVVLICIGFAVSPARAADLGPTGEWVTASHDAVVVIRPSGADLCGSISGIVLAPADRTPVDWQGQTQCGLVIVKVSASPVSDDNRVWQGSIVDPRDGSVYHARLSFDANHNLLLRGYIGLPVFGETQTWTRYEGTNLPSDCRIRGLSVETAGSASTTPNG